MRSYDVRLNDALGRDVTVTVSARGETSAIRAAERKLAAAGGDRFDVATALPVWVCDHGQDPEGFVSVR
jgi:hypothetical protein